MRFSQGYSVLELLIAVVLIAVVAVTGTNLLFTSLSSSGKASALNSIKQSGDYAVGLIERLVRESDSVSCPAPESLEIIDKLEGGTSVTRLVLIDSGRLLYEEGGDDYFLTGERISASAFSCTFTGGVNEAPDLVELSFTLSLILGDRPSETVTENFRTRVSLRTY